VDKLVHVEEEKTGEMRYELQMTSFVYCSGKVNFCTAFGLGLYEYWSNSKQHLVNLGNHYYCSTTFGLLILT